jgi:hypothetical protein
MYATIYLYKQNQSYRLQYQKKISPFFRQFCPTAATGDLLLQTKGVRK